MNIIDAHGHVSREWSDVSAKELFDATGLRKAFVAALPLAGWDRYATNESCARFIERFPDQTVGLIGIDPPRVDESLKAIDRYHKQGFAGVKLMPTSGYYPDDERHRKVFEEINARKMIVLTHCGWCAPLSPDLPQCTLYSHPYHVEPLIRIFPDTDFILAHGGGRVMFQAAFDLAAVHANVWIDTTPGNGLWVLEHAGSQWLDFLVWERVLFGSDVRYGDASATAGFQKTRERLRDILQKTNRSMHLEAVMGDNATRLLAKHGVEL